MTASSSPPACLADAADRGVVAGGVLLVVLDLGVEDVRSGHRPAIFAPRACRMPWHESCARSRRRRSRAGARAGAAPARAGAARARLARRARARRRRRRRRCDVRGRRAGRGVARGVRRRARAADGVLLRGSRAWSPATTRRRAGRRSDRRHAAGDGGARVGVRRGRARAARRRRADDGRPRAGCVVEIKSGDWFLAVRGGGVRSTRPVALSSERRHRPDVLGLWLPRPAGAADGRGARRADRRLLGRRRDVRARLAGVRDDPGRDRPARRGDRGRLAADRRRPGMRAEFERVGGGQVLNNSPYDLAAPWLCLREAGGVVTDGWGEPLDRHRLLGSGHEFQMSSISAANRAAARRARAGGRRGGRTAGRCTRSAAARRLAARGRGPLSCARAGSPPAPAGNSTAPDAPARLRRPQAPLRLRQHRRPSARRRDPRARRAAAGQADPARLRDRVRRRRVGDPLHARAADGRRRARVRVARDLRPRGVLQRDQGDAQRAPGQPAGSDRGAVGRPGTRYNEINARELSEGWDVCIVHDPQPAALASLVAEKARHWVWRCHIDLSTPEPSRRSSACCPTSSRIRRPCSTCRSTCRRDGRAGPHRAAGDRPAGAEEHGVLARGRGLHLRPVRDRRRPAAAVPGLALRSVEGPARRDRRLPDRQGADARRAARARRLDGHRRSRGLGLLQRHRRPRRRRPRHPHPQQPQQRRRDRGQRVPVTLRRRDPEVDPRGIRADRDRGDLEGAAVHRRRRRRDPAAGLRRRVRVPGLDRRGVRRARARDPARPGARQAARARRQGIGAPAVPDAAAAARLARAVRDSSEA